MLQLYSGHKCKVVFVVTFTFNLHIHLLGCAYQQGMMIICDNLPKSTSIDTEVIIYMKAEGRKAKMCKTVTFEIVHRDIIFDLDTMGLGPAYCWVLQIAMSLWSFVLSHINMSLFM